MSTEQTPDELGYSRAPVTFPIPPGAPIAACRTCKADIIWITTASGRKMPCNPDGTSHFATCEHAHEHRQPRGKAAPLTHDQFYALRGVAEGRQPKRTDARIGADELRRRKLLSWDQSTGYALTELGTETLDREAKSRGVRVSIQQGLLK